MSKVAKNIIKAEALFAKGKPMTLAYIAKQLGLAESGAQRWFWPVKRFIVCLAAQRRAYGLPDHRLGSDREC